MKAVVVAAGFGTRLRMGPKHLVRLWGRPLSYYPLRAVTRHAREYAIVVQSVYVEETRVVLHENGFNPVIVANFNPHSENGFSLWLGLEWAGQGPVIVSVADHVYEPRLVDMLVEGCDASICVAGDRNPRLIDIDEATKIEARGGNALRFSKRLEKFDYIDTGVFLVNDVGVVRGVAAERPDVSMNTLWNMLIEQGVDFKVVDVTGVLWADVDTEADLYAFNTGVRRLLVERVLLEYERGAGEVR